MFKTAAAGLALASIISASAKADVFDTLPDYYANSTSYVEQETSRDESNASLYGNAPEAPSLERDVFEMPDITIPARERTIEDYLNQNNIDFNSEYTTNWWEYPINIAGGYAFTLLWHEFGHYAMANIFGARDVEMHIFDGECNGTMACVTHRTGTCRDRLCRSIDYDMGQFQDTIITAAGVGFTTGANIALTSLLKNEIIPDWLRSFTATTSLMMMMDRHRYIWSSAIKHWAGINTEHDDIALVINTNFSSSEGRNAAFGVLMAASVVELALRWEEVWYLANTAIGRQVEVPEGSGESEIPGTPGNHGFPTGLGVMPGLYPYGSILMLGASGEF